MKFDIFHMMVMRIGLFYSIDFQALNKQNG